MNNTKDKLNTIQEIASNENHPKHEKLKELTKNIYESIERDYEQLSNDQLADLLLHEVWSDFELFSKKADIVEEAIERLKRYKDGE